MPLHKCKSPYQPIHVPFFDCLTMKRKATLSLEMPMTQHRTPENMNFRKHCCENLKPHIKYLLSALLRLLATLDFKIMHYAEAFLDHLNKIHQHIQFTTQTERDNCLPVPDINNYQNPEGWLNHRVYQKSTHATSD